MNTLEYMDIYIYMKHHGMKVMTYEDDMRLKNSSENWDPALPKASSSSSSARRRGAIEPRAASFHRRNSERDPKGVSSALNRPNISKIL